MTGPTIHLAQLDQALAVLIRAIDDEPNCPLLWKMFEKLEAERTSQASKADRLERARSRLCTA